MLNSRVVANPRFLSVTSDGRRFLAKAEQTIAAHQELMAEAARSKRELAGTLRLGAGSNSNEEAVGRLVTAFAERQHVTKALVASRLGVGLESAANPVSATARR